MFFWRVKLAPQPWSVFPDLFETEINAISALEHLLFVGNQVKIAISVTHKDVVAVDSG